MEILNNENRFCLAENLRALRKRVRWSQEELAEKVGLNRGNIASYENGTAEPKICNLVKLAHLFTISVFDLTHVDLKEENSYTQATLQHQNGHRLPSFPPIGHFVKEAEDFQQAIKGLHCLFRLKVKNVLEPSEEMQSLTDQFEQLHSLTEQLLHSHLDLIALIKEKCTDNAHSSDAASQDASGS